MSLTRRSLHLLARGKTTLGCVFISVEEQEFQSQYERLLVHESNLPEDVRTHILVQPALEQLYRCKGDNTGKY